MMWNYIYLTCWLQRNWKR